MLAVTELAANAIVHTASGQDGKYTISIRTGPQWARIEVTDGGPSMRRPAPGNGRGLALVAGLTDRAGAETAPGGRRTAWAEVTWPA
jgi:anti-sigma regulatory factor (Ser/Thr protein kinase)